MFNLFKKVKKPEVEKEEYNIFGDQDFGHPSLEEMIRQKEAKVKSEKQVGTFNHASDSFSRK